MYGVFKHNKGYVGAVCTPIRPRPATQQQMFESIKLDVFTFSCQSPGKLRYWDTLLSYLEDHPGMFTYIYH